MLKTTLEQKIKNGNKHIILIGDFNYDLLKHKYDENVSKFLNILYSSFLLPCIRGPTRFVKGNGPILADTIFINIVNNKLSSGNLHEEITVDLPNFLRIENIYSNQNKIKKIIQGI